MKFPNLTKTSKANEKFADLWIGMTEEELLALDAELERDVIQEAYDLSDGF